MLVSELLVTLTHTDAHTWSQAVDYAPTPRYKPAPFTTAAVQPCLTRLQHSNTQVSSRERPAVTHPTKHHSLDNPCSKNSHARPGPRLTLTPVNLTLPPAPMQAHIRPLLPLPPACRHATHARPLPPPPAPRSPPHTRTAALLLAAAAAQQVLNPSHFSHYCCLSLPAVLWGCFSAACSPPPSGLVRFSSSMICGSRSSRCNSPTARGAGGC